MEGPAAGAPRPRLGPRQVRRGGGARREFRDGPTLLSYGALAGYASGCMRTGPRWPCSGPNWSSLHHARRVLGDLVGRAALVGVSFAPVARGLPRRPCCGSRRPAPLPGPPCSPRPVPSRSPCSARLCRLRWHRPAHLHPGDSVRPARRPPRPGAERSQRGRGRVRGARPSSARLVPGHPARLARGLGLPVLLFAGLYLRYRHQPLPAPAGRPTGRQARLSLSCWLLAGLVAVGSRSNSA